MLYFDSIGGAILVIGIGLALCIFSSVQYASVSESFIVFDTAPSVEDSSTVFPETDPT